MNGRLENDLIREEKTKKILVDLPKYAEDFYYNLTASGYTSATCLEMIKKIKAFHQWLDKQSIKMEDITESTMSKYLTEKNKKVTKTGEITSTSYSYRKTLIAFLKDYFEYLSKKGIVKNNYMSDITPPRKKDNIKRYKITPDKLKEVENRILEELQDKKSDDMVWEYKLRDLLIFNLFVNTGMRLTALSEINIDDINFETHELVITDKRDKKHLYILNDKVMDILNSWIETRRSLLSNSENDNFNALFLSRQKKRMRGNAIYYIIKKYTTEIIGEEGVSPHKLRAACATILYDKTHDIEFVRRAIGHENVETTQRYIVTNDVKEVKQKASNIMGSLF